MQKGLINGTGCIAIDKIYHTCQSIAIKNAKPYKNHFFTYQSIAALQ